MEKTVTKKEQLQYTKARIPDTLVYEIMNKKPIYYRGYKKVIQTKIDIEGIMGTSVLQSILIGLILKEINKNLNEEIYYALSSELGLYVDVEDKLVADIAIFETKQLFSKKIEDKYQKIPPKIILEIDTKADLSNFENVLDYYTQKTNKLFNFGVEKVFWILTKNKQIIEAVPNDKWIIQNWDSKIEIIKGFDFTIDGLLTKNKLSF